jgi:hypothetical protein
MLSAVILLAIIFGAAFYFAPSIVAVLRKKTNTAAIVVLNTLLGWSLIGWAIAMIWAVSADNQPQTIIIHNHEND